MTTTADFARRAAFLWSALASGAVLAHPGHDTAPAMGFWQGLAHLLTQPDHVGWLVTASVIGVLAWRAGRSGSRRGNRRADRG